LRVVARTGLPILLLLLLVACETSRGATPFIAERSADSGDAPGPGLSRRTLSNGVRILVEERPGTEVVALQLWVAAGARDEAATELGLAHCLEHMLFKGTVSRPPGFVEREVEAGGGRMNAGTSWDYTYYHVVVPASRALAMVDVFADLSANASLGEAQLEREKKVILEEMRLAEDHASGFLMRKAYEAVFAGHPYGRPVLGRPEIVRGLTREQLLNFYRRLYVPEALTLVVVGPVTARDVVAAAERAFARIPRSGARRLPPALPSAPGRTIAVVRPSSHAYLALGWAAPRIDHADAPALDLLAWILGQGRSARLGQRLRDRLGLVSTVYAGYGAMEGAGIVSVAAETERGNLERVEREIVSEIERVREAGVTPEELRRALTVARARHEARRETAEDRAFMLGHAETTWSVEDALAYLDRLGGVSGEQLRSAARRHLDPAGYARVILGSDPPR
jgi:zinc protease